MSPWFRDNVEALAAYTPGYQPADRSAIKINTNENPYPPSPKVFEALARLDGESLRRYPPVLWDEFRRAAAAVHGVEPEMIMAGNGGDELLAILVRCCCGPRRPLAYPVPTYSLYPVLAAIQDAGVREIPFGADYAIPEALSETAAGLTILCNPNAPTASFVPVDRIAELAGRLDHVLLIDEAYVDFAEDNCLRLLAECPNVVILRSMSKGYSLAGMRFGYVIGAKRIIETMIKVKDSYNVNIAAQAAATAAIRDRDYFDRNVRRIIDERERLRIALGELGFGVGDSRTNFLLAAISRPPARKVYEKLTERNIYVRYFNQEGLADKLRISVGTSAQNDALREALEEIIRQG
ncbi:MAG: histidinol-phosphate transaminase [Sedimentisphaerales bacterium]|nr:histidinol-phosphate transaminase [Sedimentisphaerales bacterium]